MSEPAPTSALLDGRAPDGGKAMLAAFLRVLASLVTAIAIFAVTLLAWAQNERAAGRTIIQSQKSGSYLSMVASGFVAVHGRPAGL